MAEAAGPGDRVADVGCGTGILTDLLADRGLDVVGIDPNEDMLAEARRAGGRAEYRGGEAAATGLGDASVALVTVAQAFHWFDTDAALGELHRVLRPGGHVAALWNLRASGPLMAEYDRLLRRFSREYGSSRAGTERSPACGPTRASRRPATTRSRTPSTSTSRGCGDGPGRAPT